MTSAWSRPHFAGNSLGGRLALEAGAAGRAASVTTLSPAGFFRGQADVRYARSIFTGHAGRGQGARAAAPVLLRSTAGRGLVYFAVVRRPSQLTSEQARGDMAAFLASGDAVKVILAGTDQFTGLIPADVPVTIAWGAQDRLLPRRQAIVAKAQLPSAHFVLLRGCGHVPMTDNPAMVAGVLLRGSASPGARSG